MIYPSASTFPGGNRFPSGGLPDLWLLLSQEEWNTAGTPTSWDLPDTTIWPEPTDPSPWD